MSLASSKKRTSQQEAAAGLEVEENVPSSNLPDSPDSLPSPWRRYLEKVVEAKIREHFEAQIGAETRNTEKHDGAMKNNRDVERKDIEEGDDEGERDLEAGIFQARVDPADGAVDQSAEKFIGRGKGSRSAAEDVTKSHQSPVNRGFEGPNRQGMDDNFREPKLGKKSHGEKTKTSRKIGLAREVLHWVMVNWPSSSSKQGKDKLRQGRHLSYATTHGASMQRGERLLRQGLRMARGLEAAADDVPGTKGQGKGAKTATRSTKVKIGKMVLSYLIGEERGLNDAHENEREEHDGERRLGAGSDASMQGRNTTRQPAKSSQGHRSDRNFSARSPSVISSLSSHSHRPPSHRAPVPVRSQAPSTRSRAVALPHPQAEGEGRRTFHIPQPSEGHGSDRNSSARSPSVVSALSSHSHRSPSPVRSRAPSAARSRAGAPQAEEARKTFHIPSPTDSESST